MGKASNIYPYETTFNGFSETSRNRISKYVTTVCKSDKCAWRRFLSQRDVLTVCDHRTGQKNHIIFKKFYVNTGKVSLFCKVPNTENFD